MLHLDDGRVWCDKPCIYLFIYLLHTDKEEVIIRDGQIKVIAITFPHYNTALHFGIYHQMKYKSKKSFWKKLVKTIHPYGYFNHDIKMIY